MTSEVVDEIPGRPTGYVPHHLPGTNAWLKDAAKEFGIPEEALRGGRRTTYPEYRPPVTWNNFPQSSARGQETDK